MFHDIYLCILKICYLYMYGLFQKEFCFTFEGIPTNLTLLVYVNPKYPCPKCLSDFLTVI